MHAALLVLLAVPGGADAAVVAQRIDEIVARHWQGGDVRPAPRADDAELLRRVRLDLTGRIPTVEEVKAFLADTSPDKRTRLIGRLIAGPEYPLHMGRVLDDILQEDRAGDGAFLQYLRTSMSQRKPWDRIFAEVLAGPWDKEAKGAERFLSLRARSIDDLTNDTSRSFFGVNVSCAQCHDHPLAPDWTQDHYYGMASFFARTQANKDTITEKASGDVTFNTTRGERRTAKMMFLSSEVVEDPKEKKKDYTRRRQLVDTALKEKTFLSRAIVNRMWSYFLGRGLVHPIDQMHSGNPSAVPDLLEWLAQDLAANGYDLDRLVAGIVSSEAYQVSSAREGAEEPASPHYFAQAQLRPLTPEQYAMSLVLALGDEGFGAVASPEEQARRFLDLERKAGQLTGPKLLDQRSDRYQASANEALYMSNHAGVQALFQPAGKNLVARLAAIEDPAEAVETAVWALLSRPPRPDEKAFLAGWLRQHGPDRARAAGQLAWALATSAEFRFNH